METTIMGFIGLYWGCIGTLQNYGALCIATLFYDHLKHAIAKESPLLADIPAAFLADRPHAISRLPEDQK